MYLNCNALVDILCEGTEDSRSKVIAVLEDVESPTTKKTIETLYQSLIDKRHVDFGDIPKSRGSITSYSGYKSMIDTLEAVKTLSKDDAAYAGIYKYAKIVSDAISYITQLAPLYALGVSKRIKAIELEYNAFVFTCVEATTALLYQFSNFMIAPTEHELKVNIANTKYRADGFFFDQLAAFNAENANGGYPRYLKAMVSGGTENFLGTPLAIGSIAIVTTVLVAIVPVTRTIVYAVQELRGRLADCLELQGYFLELNKTALEADTSRTPEEKKRILDKQDKVRLQFLRLADKLRVKSLKAEELAKKKLNDDNRTISIGDMRNQVDEDDDFSIF